jgi:PDZ domain-containing protein
MSGGFTMRRWIVWALPLAALLLAATRLWLPVYSIGPGPAREVSPLIRVDGRAVYASEGEFVLTSVRIERLTPLSALVTWIDPARSVIERSEVYPAGTTDAEERERAVSEMDQSKLDATYVVLSELTDYPQDHGRGVLIEHVVDGCSADGELYPGDLVLRIDGTKVSTVRDARRLIDAAPSGSALTFDIRAGGERHAIDLVRGRCGGSEEPLVGVAMIPSFPFGVSIESGGISGPSAGLMWAVALHDLLTTKDLTGGMTIAGTGVLLLDGTVVPISGVREKIAAAARAGADVFLVPKDNLREAGPPPDGIRLVPVETLGDALDFLRGDGP